MKAFMDANFLLKTETAQKLFHDCADKQPIIDYHCHLNSREIWENKPFTSITSVWLGGDHYKWRLMRCAGIPEKYITGDASDYEKFEKWVEVVGKAIGNPLYHWSHLELQRFFDCNLILNKKNARAIWDFCNAKLQSPEFTPRALIERSNVVVICTTDDPVDSLEYHRLLAADTSFPVRVLPAWRPDKVLNMEASAFEEYIKRLSDVSGIAISNISSLLEAVSKRMDFFAENGCSLSDHGQNIVMYVPCSEETANEIFQKRLCNKPVTQEEILQYKTYILQFLAHEYARRNWVMQLHYGAKRNNNPVMFKRLGPDTGYDSIGDAAPVSQLTDFLGSLGEALPKTIVYSLDPNDDTMISTVLGCFQNGEGITKLQHGSAWWFNDHIDGMEKQMKALANEGYLAGFVGMLTDSRSFLSYPRHEYFRRILCNIIGEWVEEGLFPADEEILEEIVAGICYENAKKYFGFLK